MNAFLATIAAISGGSRFSPWAGAGDTCEDSLLDTIYSPLTAAAVFLVAVAKAGGPISDATANMICDELKCLSGRHDVTELLVFSGWITEHERCPDQIAGKFGKLWRRAMNRSKRRALLSATSNVVACSGSGSPAQLQAIRTMQHTLS